MKDFLTGTLVVLGIVLGAVGLIIGAGEFCLYVKHRNYLVRIDCSNCKQYFCYSRVPRGEPIPPEPLKCDECGNMTGSLHDRQ